MSPPTCRGSWATRTTSGGAPSPRRRRRPHRGAGADHRRRAGRADAQPRPGRDVRAARGRGEADSSSPTATTTPSSSGGTATSSPRARTGSITTCAASTTASIVPRACASFRRARRAGRDQAHRRGDRRRLPAAEHDVAALLREPGAQPHDRAAGAGGRRYLPRRSASQQLRHGEGRDRQQRPRRHHEHRRARPGALPLGAVHQGDGDRRTARRHALGDPRQRPTPSSTSGWPRKPRTGR